MTIKELNETMTDLEGVIDEKFKGRPISLDDAAKYADELVAKGEAAQDAVISQEIPRIRAVAKEIRAVADKLEKSVEGFGGK
jgi:polyhydroxyalkanoate synthesis regulator phasin